MTKGRGSRNPDSQGRVDLTLAAIVEKLEGSGGVVFAQVRDTTTGRLVRSFASPFLTALCWLELFDLGLWPNDSQRVRISDCLYQAADAGRGWAFFGPDGGYPPDSDDTAVIAECLWRLGRLRDARKVTTMLLRNRRSDGRFFVWLSPNGLPPDDVVEMAVDVNVSSFLARVCPGYTLPQSLVGAIVAFPDDHESVFYTDVGVQAWLLSKLACSLALRPENARHRALVSRHLQDNLQEVAIRSAFEWAAPLVAARVGAVLKRSVVAPGGNPRQKGRWFFRHRTRSLAYECALLDELLQWRARMATKLDLKPALALPPVSCHVPAPTSWRARAHT